MRQLQEQEWASNVMHQRSLKLEESVHMWEFSFDIAEAADNGVYGSMSYRFLISNKQDTHLIASLGFKTFQKWVLRYLALWAKRRGNYRTKHFASDAEQSLRSHHKSM
ncbi:hypothetical protein Tco_0261880 [Tanacetum coccineum]